LDTIASNFFDSEEYEMFTSSDKSKQLQYFQMQVLNYTGTFILDCLMTTICTDRPLPAPIDDYKKDSTSNSDFADGYGTNQFERLYEKKMWTRSQCYRCTIMPSTQNWLWDLCGPISFLIWWLMLIVKMLSAAQNARDKKFRCFLGMIRQSFHYWQVLVHLMALGPHMLAYWLLNCMNLE